MVAPNKPSEDTLVLQGDPEASGAFDRIGEDEQELVEFIWDIVQDGANDRARTSEPDDIFPSLPDLVRAINDLAQGKFQISESEARELCGKLYAFILNMVHMMGHMGDSGVDDGAHDQIAHFLLKSGRISKKSRLKGVKLDGTGAYGKLKENEQKAVERIFDALESRISDEFVVEEIYEILSGLCTVEPEDIEGLIKDLSTHTEESVDAGDHRAEDELKDKIAYFILLKGMEDHDIEEEDEKILQMSEAERQLVLKVLCSTIRKQRGVVTEAQSKISTLIQRLEKHIVEALIKRGINAEHVPDCKNFAEKRGIAWTTDSRIAIPKDQFSEARIEVGKILKERGVEDFLELKPHMFSDPMGCSLVFKPR